MDGEKERLGEGGRGERQTDRERERERERALPTSQKEKWYLLTHINISLLL